jgi:hypothetical protein
MMLRPVKVDTLLSDSVTRMFALKVGVCGSAEHAATRQSVIAEQR